MPSGRRVANSCEYLAAGTILPRALPVMSGTRHSTSVIRRSLNQRLIALSCSSALSSRGFSFLRRAIRSGGSGLVGASGQAPAAGRGEGLEDAEVEGVFPHLPFGVPLHREQEGV